jgi:hypothetical protein
MVSISVLDRIFPVIPAAPPKNGFGYHPKVFRGRGSTTKRCAAFFPMVNKAKGKKP